MHCRSCELLIEDELKKLPGVKRVEVNHKKGLATVYSHQSLLEADVFQAVEKAGYTCGVDKIESGQLFTSNPKAYKELGLAVLIGAGLFLLAKGLGIFNLGANISGNYGSLSVVFLVGLTAGVSTCMALVGGIVLGASAKYSQKHPEASGIAKFKPHLFFNLGRIISYIIFGALIGFLGSVFQLSSTLLGILTIGVGLVMLLLGTQLIDMFPVLNKVSITLPKSVSRFFGIRNRSDKEYSHKNSWLLGALTFFLPCGFTQAMQLYSISTGDPVAGALTMGVFALGTAPGLLGVGGLASAIKGPSMRLFFKTAGIVVIALSLFNIKNGTNLIGLYPSPPRAVAKISDPNVKIIDGIQVVRMRQVATGYIPNKLTIKKDLPVRWIIDSKTANTCAASLVSQKLNVRQRLKLGENVITFTPTQTGIIHFSCSMGMYTGSFTVVEGT
jgi:sulfite exporter TauE/SafE/copper chaperone CopZ